MKSINKGIVIFSAHVPRATEWDTARGIKVERNTDGSVRIRVSSETETEDIEYKSKTITVEEAVRLGRALLCMDEEDAFDDMAKRAEKWSE